MIRYPKIGTSHCIVQNLLMRRGVIFSSRGCVSCFQ